MSRRPLLMAAVALLIATACREQGGTRFAETAGEPTGEPTGQALPPNCDDLEAEVQVDGPLSDDPEVAAIQQARADSGLPSDEETVERIIAETGGEDGPLGFPHTEEELDEVMGRNPDPDRVEGIRTWAEQEAPDSYAGLWLSQPAGILTVAFATDLDRNRAEVHDRFGEDIAVVEVEHPLAELEAIAEQVGEEFRPAGDEVPRITGWAVYEQHNRVGVEILGEDDELPRALAERFDADRLCVNVEGVPQSEDAQVADWEPDGEVDRTATHIPVHVMERGCAGGEPATGRIPEPHVQYREDAVVVTFRVIPKGGPQTCPGNPPTPYVLELSEPLGDRQLLDGGAEPPAPPVLDQ